MNLKYKALLVFVVFISGLFALNYFQWSLQDKNITSAKGEASSFIQSSFQGKMDEYRDSMISAVTRIKSAHGEDRLFGPLAEDSVEIAAIDSFLEGARLDFMFLVNADNQIILAREYDYYRDIARPLRDGNIPLVKGISAQLQGKGNLAYGGLLVDEDPVYVAMTTIPDLQTGKQGYLVVGSYFSTLIGHIENTLNLEVVVANAGKNSEKNLLNGTPWLKQNGVSYKLDTLSGQPLQLQLYRADQALLATPQYSANWGIWLMMVLLAAFAIWGMVYKPVLREIRRIVDQLNQIQMDRRYTDRLEVKGDDEFAKLSTRVNGILSTLEYAYNLVVKNSEVTSGLLNEVEQHRENLATNQVVHDTTQSLTPEDRMHMVSRLSRAIEREELTVVFQPQYEPVDQHVLCVTALARWEDEELGGVAPSQFIPLAENSGLMGALGEVLMKKACVKAKSWQNAGLRPIPVAVKLSRQQFNDKRLVAMVAGALATSKLEPRFLELEVKERIILENIEHSIETLTTLSQIGVQLVIDNYIGEGSMVHLNRLPVNKIKLDPIFVSDVGSGGRDASLIEGIVKLGSSLGLTVIASGVETEEQLFALQENNHHIGLQGFYLGRPVTSEQLIPQLTRVEVPRLVIAR